MVLLLFCLFSMVCRLVNRGANSDKSDKKLVLFPKTRKKDFDLTFEYVFERIMEPLCCLKIVKQKKHEVSKQAVKVIIKWVKGRCS